LGTVSRVPGGLAVTAVLLTALLAGASSPPAPKHAGPSPSSPPPPAAQAADILLGDGSAPYGDVAGEPAGRPDDGMPAMQLAADSTLTTQCSGPNTAEAHRREAALISRVNAAARAARARVAVAVHDYRTGITCSYASSRAYDSASVVKASILATLLLQAQDHHRSLTATERSWATASITRSDNAATDNLWNRIGGNKGLAAFLKRAGMTHTVPGSGGTWGLTRITAADETVLLRALARPGLLTAASRSYELGLMRKVISSQRWGVTTGAAPGTTAALKNGWLPRATAGWRVHSIGYVTGNGHDYVLAVLSDNNSTMSSGVTVVNSLSRAVNTALR
jgi:beta-lactamase class A